MKEVQEQFGLVPAQTLGSRVHIVTMESKPGGERHRAAVTNAGDKRQAGLPKAR